MLGDSLQLADQSLLGGEGVAQQGQSEVLGRNPDGNWIRRVTLLNCECDPKLAQMVTIMLCLARRTPAQTIPEENETLPLFARVHFGNGGTQSRGQLEVDYVNGAAFAVPAGFIRLDAHLEDDEPETQIGIEAGAFMGYFPHVRTRSPQRTLPLGAMEPSDPVIVRIPYFADRVELMPTVLGATFQLEQLVDAAGTIVVGNVAIPAAAPVHAVPLVNQARYIRVTNTSMAATGARAIFQLTV